VNAYSQDLREKIVEAVAGRGMGKSEAARAFGVSLSSVKRYVAMARKGVPLAPKRSPGSKPKLDERARSLLLADLEVRPFATLYHRAEYLKALTGISVSNSTVCREIKRVKCTRKKGA